MLSVSVDNNAQQNSVTEFLKSFGNINVFLLKLGVNRIGKINNLLSILEGAAISHALRVDSDNQVTEGQYELRVNKAKSGFLKTISCIFPNITDKLTTPATV